jgi:hypothetical protein
MPAATCGGAPVDGVVAISLGPDLTISLTLVRSPKGYCFSAWSCHDDRAMPEVSEADRLRAFDTEQEAVNYFRTLFQTLNVNPDS